MEVSIANAQTKPRSLFAMLRNKNAHLIITPEIAWINRFVSLSASSVTLISGQTDFRNTYFCFQRAILELYFAKNSQTGTLFCKLELSYSIYLYIIYLNWKFKFQSPVKQCRNKFCKLVYWSQSCNRLASFFILNHVMLCRRRAKEDHYGNV